MSVPKMSLLVYHDFASNTVGIVKKSDHRKKLFIVSNAKMSIRSAVIILSHLIFVCMF